jgi:hypothetical protein
MSGLPGARIVLAAAIAGLGWTSDSSPVVASPQIVFDSHVNATPGKDRDAFYLRVTNPGDPTTIHDLNVNDQCRVDFYQKADPILAPSGDPVFFALTVDQANRMITPSNKNWAALVKTPLVIKPGDHVSIIIPAVEPLTAFGGFPGAGSCGMSLDRFRADTDTGEVDWEAPPP